MSEKVVIITGASRGIGSAIARYLLKEGHKVFLVARTAEPLESLEKEFKGQVAIFAGDLGDLKVGWFPIVFLRKIIRFGSRRSSSLKLEHMTVVSYLTWLPKKIRKKIKG
jgi:NAD(P)-dependent dehydrogenase (short-subunit alcohol dehydrogenase family)